MFLFQALQFYKTLVEKNEPVNNSPPIFSKKPNHMKNFDYNSMEGYDSDYDNKPEKF